MLSRVRSTLNRAASLATLLIAAAAPAQTFTNSGSISIPSSGPADPFPSSILVSGVAQPVAAIRVTLRGVEHSYPSDVAVAVRSPAGNYYLLATGVGSSTDVSNADITFASDALQPIGSTLQAGTFLPTRGFDRDFSGAVPDSSAMPLGFGNLSVIQPNGTWSLFVIDDVGGDDGSIASGWSISFDRPLNASGTSIYQGVLATNGSPFTGTADVEFQVFGQATGGVALGGTQSQTVQVTNGLFQVPIQVGGDPLTALDPRWLQLAVNGQILSPRQELRPAPAAVNAQRAVSMPWSGLSGQASIGTGAVGSGWQLFFTNNASGFRGGMRLADNGFFEVTNVATNANPNFARLNSTGAWTAVSDRRLKHDIHAAEGNLAAALKLQPVAFRWNLDDREDTGLIAQDVREVLPHLVTGDESKENLTVNYSQLSVVAIGAIQEQQQKIESLEQRLLDQTRRNDDLQSRLETLEQLLGATK
ncbi:MAG: tail fiber domain-containing protein [Phycisphaerae bacterium]|jgi:subtilisin-like proprotein convertase family protein